MGKRNIVTLPAIDLNNRPKILLTGNGINKSFEEELLNSEDNRALNTEKLFAEKWRENYRTEMPEEFKNLPFPMQAVIATKDNVNSCMAELAEIYKKTKTVPRQQQFIGHILGAGFDAVLSTNYSLEFENAVIPACTPGRIKSCFYRRTKVGTGPQNDFGMFQFTELPFADKPSLWHIHGTGLRKQSMVMGDYYYGKLLSLVTARAADVIAKYKKCLSNGKAYIPESWVDYFLLGDVYSFGFKFDLSESDIWWLLCCKKRNFPDSVTEYFTPKQPGVEKRMMLDAYGVKVRTDIRFGSGDDKYIEFYKAVCDEIRNR